MAGYTTPGGVNYELIDVNGKVTTLYDPDADYIQYGGTSGLGASMTGEIVGGYTDKTASNTWHGFVYDERPMGNGRLPSGPRLHRVGTGLRERLRPPHARNLLDVRH